MQDGKVRGFCMLSRDSRIALSLSRPARYTNCMCLLYYQDREGVGGSISEVPVRQRTNRLDGLRFGFFFGRMG